MTIRIVKNEDVGEKFGRKLGVTYFQKHIR